MFTVALLTYYGKQVCEEFETLKEAREFAAREFTAREESIYIDCEITDGDKQYEVVAPTLN